jgi:hypothetical protein
MMLKGSASSVLSQGHLHDSVLSMRQTLLAGEERMPRCPNE